MTERGGEETRGENGLRRPATHRKSPLNANNALPPKLFLTSTQKLLLTPHSGKNNTIVLKVFLQELCTELQYEMNTCLLVFDASHFFNFALVIIFVQVCRSNQTWEYILYILLWGSNYNKILIWKGHFAIVDIYIWCCKRRNKNINCSGVPLPGYKNKFVVEIANNCVMCL